MKQKDIDLINELTQDEPNLCSIEFIADIPGASGGMVIDQSLDITLRGELNAAMKAVRFLFPELPDPDREGGSIYSLNRAFIEGMIQTNFWDGKFELTGREGNIKITFKANRSSSDIGHLINAIRANGGATYIEKGLRAR